MQAGLMWAKPPPGARGDSSCGVTQPLIDPQPQRAAIQCPFCLFENLTDNMQSRCLSCGLELGRMIAKATGSDRKPVLAEERPEPPAPRRRKVRKKRISKRQRLRQEQEQSPSDQHDSQSAFVGHSVPTTPPVFGTPTGLVESAGWGHLQLVDQSPNALSRQLPAPFVSPQQVIPPALPATANVFNAPATDPDLCFPLDDEADETVIVSRPSATKWGLEFEGGLVVDLMSEHVVVGRKPQATNGATTAIINDATKTLSRSHARLQRDTVTDTWTVEDLDSANGVATVDANGVITSLSPGVPTPATEYLDFGGLRARLVHVP